MYEALENSDALLLVTEWKEFRIPDWIKFKNIMLHELVIDGRNIYNRSELEQKGIHYIGIGQ